MKQFVKIGLLAVAAFVVLVLVIVVIATQVVDPNDYKAQIAALVEEHTGLKAEFNGPIELKILPRIAVSVQDVVLASEGGDKAAPLVSVHEANLRMALFPLLRGRVEVDSVFVKGVDVNLAKDKKGKANWVVREQAEPVAAPTEEIGGVPVVVDSGDATPAFRGGIASVQLEDCRFHYEDAALGQEYILSLKQLNLTDVAPDQDMRFALAASVEDRARQVTGQVAVSGSVMLAPERSELLVNVRELQVEGHAAKDMASMVVTLAQGKIALNMQTLSAQAELMSFAVKGRLQEQMLNADTSFASGTFRYAPEDNTVRGEISALTAASASQSLKYDGKASLEAISLAYDVPRGKAQVEFKTLEASGRYDPDGVDAQVSSVGGKATYDVERGDLSAALSGFDASGKAAPGDLRANFSVAGDAALALADSTPAVTLATTRLKLDGAYDDGNLNAQFKTSGSARMDTRAGSAALSLPDLTITAKTPQLKKAQTLRGNVTVNGNPKTLSGNVKMALSGDDLKVNLAGTVADPVKTLKADGTVDVKSNPSALLDLVQLGLHPADAKALSKVDVSSTFAFVSNELTLKRLAVNVDGVPINATGSVKLPGAKGLAKGLDYALAADVSAGRLNMDAYLPPQKEEGTSSGAAAGEVKPAGVDGAVAAAGPLQGSALEKVDAAVNFNAQAITVSGVTLDNPVLNLRANRGMVTMSSFKAGIFEGTVDASGSAALASVNPPVRAKAALKGINAEKLLTFIGAGGQYVRGSLDANADLSFNGLATPTLFPTLNGSGSFALNNGMIQNFQVIPADAPPLLAQLRQKDYPLQVLSGSFKAVNGVISNDDLTMTSAKLNASGAGTVNLAALNMDYRLRLIVPGKVELPLRAHGPFSKLTYGIDADAVAKEALSKALHDIQNKGVLPTQEQVSEKLQEQQVKLEQKIETKREAVNQKITDEIEKGLGKLPFLKRK